MDKKLKAKWVKALRSGEYKQARGAMKTEAGYCCLGVLKYIVGADAFDDRTMDEHRRELICMNDGVQGFKQKSFKQIANFIEKNL